MRRLNPSLKPVVRQRGLSVIEVMVALAASLIVVGSVLAFTVATVRSNAETIRATRLTQDMRVVMGLVIRDIRRAGYTRNAELGLGSGNFDRNLPFAPIFIADDLSCVAVAYDNPSTGDVGRAFRRVEVDGFGVMQASLGTADPDCDAAVDDADWFDLTNPQQVDVIRFEVTTDGEDDPDGCGGIRDVVAGQTDDGDIVVTIRDLCVRMAGSLAGDAATTRQMRERVRVRADLVTFPPPPVAP